MRSRDRDYFESINSIYFVASTIVGFVKVFDDPLYKKFIGVLKFYQERGDFTILGYVLMPNHFHLVAKTAEGKAISNCIGNIKRITSRQITCYLTQNNKERLLNLLKQKAKTETFPDSRIWKPRFDCMVIVKEEILIQKLEYSHLNPVRAGLVKDILDWPYSSARNYADSGNVVLGVDTQWKSIGY